MTINRVLITLTYVEMISLNAVCGYLAGARNIGYAAPAFIALAVAVIAFPQAVRDWNR